MTILPWPQRKTQIAIEDAQMRQHVEHALRVLDQHRGLDWQRGYREGYHRGFLLGVGMTCAACVAVWLWLWLSGAVN